jgi:O-antigen/teichoic acid export membrane protein
MGFGFVLFLLLAWRSREDVGVFRTVVTYLAISELLPLLGMQKWLATEMSQRVPARRQLLILGLIFSLITSLIISACYLVIAHSDVYGPDISTGLRLIAAAAVASGVVLTTNAALVGIGLSHTMGVLNLTENLVRSTIGISLVLIGAPLYQIILVFLLCRWSIAVAGVVVLLPRLPNYPTAPTRDMFLAFTSHISRLATIMVAFLVTRYAGLILLPWLRGENEAGIFAVPFQLYDLVMLVPTVFVISSTFVFNKSATKGNAALRRNIDQLIYLTSILVFPIMSLSVVMGEQIILVLFGPTYLSSVIPFQLLMIATAVTALDQILSQAIVAARQYRIDLISVAVGAAAAVISTYFLSVSHGASGTAAAFLLSLTLTLLVRILLVRGFLRLNSFWRLISRQVTAAIVAGIFVWFARQLVPGIFATASRYWLPLLLIIGFALYIGMFYWTGGLDTTKRKWMLRFLRGKE